MSGRPAFDPADAVRLAREVWEIDARAAVPLPGDRDRNFLLSERSGPSWVLKIAPADASEDEILLETSALAWLAERDGGLPVPRLRASPGEGLVARVADAGGTPHAARLATHLPGRVLAEARPRTPELLRDLGRVLARLDLALDGFAPPARRAADFAWDLRNAGRVMEEGLPALEGARRERVAALLELFRRDAEPRLPALPRALVHGDANDHNVLVEEPVRDPPGPARRVTGIIDFGDLLEAPRVTEAAVAAAYALLGDPDPLHAAAAVVGGYHEVLPLAQEELEVVWPLVLARLGVSVTISARRAAAEPDDPYLRVSEAPAWEALGRLSAVHPRLARAVLRHACGHEPCPRSRDVRGWLERHRQGASPVLPAEAMARPIVLDLSVASTELPPLDALPDGRRFARHVTRRLEDAGATVGIGRWDEARPLYRGALFDHPSGDPLLRRTVHLAVDLYAPADTPVLAPLDGRIHSLRDNAGFGDYGPTVIVEHAPGDGPVFWTLFGHLARASLHGLEPGQPVAKGEAFARLGDVEENGEWPPHLHFQVITDLLDRKGEFPGVASPHEREAWLSLSPDPGLLLELPEGAGAPPGSNVEDLLGRRHVVLGPNLSVSYRRPLHAVRGWRQHLYDPEGRPYLDCVNNVAHVGHAHPRVVEAAARQKAALETNTRYLHELVLRYAERLLATFPEPLGVCWLVSSGSEANELALRIARAATGRRHVVVLEGAYHGNTTSLIDVSPYKHGGPGGEGPPPWVHVAAMPDDYRGRWRRDDPERAARYAGEVAEAARHSGGACAFLHESFLSCAGQIELPPGYLEHAYAAVRAAGGVVIADEVQVGLGRVGSHFWGFQTQGVVPDIVTLGKPLGNGHPLGAVVTTREVAHAFDNGVEYFSTFGGNPASCAVGLAVLDVLGDEGLQAHATRVGGRLLAGLRELAERHPAMGDVRGRGLFLGIELVRNRETREPDAAVADYLVQRARERGVLLSTDGPDHHVIKIKPPMVFDERDADRLVALLDELFGEDFVRAAAEQVASRTSPSEAKDT